MEITKDWLVQKYVVERLSTVQIGKIVGVPASTIESMCKRNGIQLRGLKDAAKIRKRKGFKAKELNDKEWLRSKYWDKLLTSYEIADLCGSNQHSVMRALKFHNIPSRDLKEAAKYKDPIPPSYFKELNNPEWLKQKYEVEKLSPQQISDIVQCSPSTICKHLHKNGISIEIHRSDAGGFRGSYKYDQLNDPEWLQQKYIGEKLSTEGIAEIVGVKTCNSVRQALHRNNIPICSISDGLTRNRKDDGFVLNVPAIDGGLFGDAYMILHNRESITGSYPHLDRRNKFYDHVYYVGQQIFSGEFSDRITPEYHKCNGKTFKYYHMSTLSHKELLPVYRRWYPKWNNYVKVIPDDISITPEMLLHAFLDDGCSHCRKRSGKKQITIIICSQAFQRDEQQFFAEKIDKAFGIKMSVRKVNTGTGWALFVRQKYAGDFYNVIGPPPVASLAYKWK